MRYGYMCRRSRSLSVLLLLGAAFLTVRAQAVDPCTAPAAILEAIDSLPVRSPSETSWEFDQRNLAAVRSLLSRYPDEMFVQRAYVSALKPYEWQKLAAEYKARHEDRPEDPQISFLYGLLLEGRRSAEAIEVLEGALAKRPDYPWPHRPLARIYRSPRFLKKDRADAHELAFLDACPDDMGAYNPLTTFKDNALLASRAAQLRALIEKRGDAQAVAGYQTLWSLEFKSRDSSRFAALRGQIGQDLERIRSLKLENRRQWYATLQTGYKLVNDRQSAERVEAELARAFPQPWPADLSQWREAHPRPGPADPPGKKREFYSLLLKQAVTWTREKPKYAWAWYLRFDALANLDNTPAEDLILAGEEFLRVADADAGPRGADNYYLFGVAEALSRKHLRPDRVIELAGRGLTQLKTAEPASDLYSTKDRIEAWAAQSWIRGHTLEAAGFLDLKRPGDARASLARADDRFKAARKLAIDDPELKQQYSWLAASWWALMGRLADAEHRPVDALSCYQSALLASFDAQQSADTAVIDALANDARQLWSRLGGTGEGWKTWYDRASEAFVNRSTITWKQVNEPLAAFELPDTKGKVWTLASLKGKVTFLNFWASW